MPLRSRLRTALLAYCYQPFPAFLELSPRSFLLPLFRDLPYTCHHTRGGGGCLMESLFLPFLDHGHIISRQLVLTRFSQQNTLDYLTDPEHSPIGFGRMRSRGTRSDADSVLLKDRISEQSGRSTSVTSTHSLFLWMQDSANGSIPQNHTVTAAAVRVLRPSRRRREWTNICQGAYVRFVRQVCAKPRRPTVHHGGTPPVTQRGSYRVAMLRAESAAFPVVLSSYMCSRGLAQ
ncbi:hypothetical protein BV20DRAFT_821429 [Pilatotrama ljubarskyi]|nr:hypothetical protein BV20DRAFT_821429 [Pilatotrama ljubarskyi]